MWKTLGMWFGVLMTFALQYGIPIYSAYFLFAESGVRPERKTWGIIATTLIVLVVIALFFAIRRWFKHARASVLKLLVELMIHSSLIYFGVQTIQYVDVNSMKLIYWLASVLGASLLTKTLQIGLIIKDRDFIFRNGVF